MTESITARFERQQHLQVGILVFPDVEVLDFAGPFEVFSVAARIAGRTIGLAKPPFTVSIISAQAAPLQARHGLGIVAHASFADAPQLDLLIVPGGVVTQPLADADTLDWIRRQDAGTALTASVCTGAFLLASAGVVSSGRVTTHWEDIADLRCAHPALEVVEDVPFVDNGRIVTSAGISAGIGMSLHLVGRILGLEMARATARQMEYDWKSQQ